MKATLKDVQRRSEIKRINTRISAIAKRFGIESETYKKTIAPFLNKTYVDITHKSKSGVLQFDTGIKKSRTAKSRKAIGIAKRTVKTFSDLTKDLSGMTEKQKISSVENQNKFDVEIKKSIDFLYENYTESELESMYPDLFSDGKPSYELLQQIVDDVSEAEYGNDLDLYNTIFGK